MKLMNFKPEIIKGKKNSPRVLTVNVDYPDFPPIADQFNSALFYKQTYPEIIAYASTFRMEGWDEPDWQKSTIEHLDSTFKQGAVGVKSLDVPFQGLKLSANVIDKTFPKAWNN